MISITMNGASTNGKLVIILQRIEGKLTPIAELKLEAFFSHDRQG